MIEQPCSWNVRHLEARVPNPLRIRKKNEKNMATHRGPAIADNAGMMQSVLTLKKSQYLATVSWNCRTTASCG